MVNDVQAAKMVSVLNWINGAETKSEAGFFEKKSPHTGEVISRVARSSEKEVTEAVLAAKKAQSSWAELPAVKRGEWLGELAGKLKEHRNQTAQIMARETGRSVKSALAEVDGAVALGLFFTGEGQRFYGRTIASGIANRQIMTVRQPLGVAALIIAANTPIANIAWKVFPALVCGNAVVLKAAEDAPETAWFFGKLSQMAGLPKGVLNIIQGLGSEAGASLVEHPDVQVISFTGSTEIGKQIAQKAAARCCRVSLELGGKNPLVVCDDADLDLAVHWTVLSAFSNTGQRCSSASRLIIFDSVYDVYRSKLVEATRKLRVGPADTDDLGPVINQKQLEKILSIVERARSAGGRILIGGDRLTDEAHADGYYMAPTLIEGVKPADEISRVEVFGPVAVLYRVKNLKEALSLSNDSSYGLTAAIHTKNLHRAHWFSEKVEAGIVSINAGTFGSEPHLPFGGFKQSGNGTREPGTEALDVYSELKNIYLNLDPEKI